MTTDDHLTIAQGHILAAQCTAAAMRAARSGDLAESERLRAIGKRVRENTRWFARHVAVRP